MSPVPRATYRLQLNREFRFADATRAVPYLARLNISHVYASPILKARPGSMHGYDVTDHTRLNPELGTEQEFEQLVAALREHEMGLIVDIVPNHLGIMGDDNAWWLDVLENGPAAHADHHFDIDWRPNRGSMRDRVLVPTLGDVYGAVLENGELKLQLDPNSGSFAVRYHEHLFPIDPREYPRIFASHPIPATVLAADDPHRADFESLMNAFANLPARSDTSEDAIAMRYRDKEAHKRRLVRLLERSPEIAQYVEAALAQINGTPGDPRSFDALDALLDAQAYRLSYWRVAVDEINYRRFFDVNDLAALRMDETGVFDSTHRLIFELIDRGLIDGLRIDHVDGLYDPEAYLERLQWKPLYVLVEKILAPHERLPETWPVQGTTGYEFAALTTSWLVCNDYEVRMTRRYRQFTESDASFEQIAYESKRLVMRSSLAAEIEVLATQLDRIAQLDRRTADFTRAGIREAIREVIACFPVYRTYVSHRGVSDEDRRIVNWAVNVARKRSIGVELSVFDFLRDVLLGERNEGRSDSVRRAMLEFAMKFQQVTSPVAAKGVEDTAMYRYNRLVCLNEVGNDPGRYGVSSAALHQANAERARSWPNTMLATSTHDTKRSEDVRARIAVLSEMPELWKRHLARWTRLNRSKRRHLGEDPAPDREDEYLLYQTLVGVWSPQEDAATLIERMQAYAVKAAREAKRSTSWISPNVEYEKALTEFIAELLGDPERSAFLRDFRVLAETVAFFGSINSLVQTVLKITAPGVPDFYQGTEFPVLTLVDPDNRRRVDFDAAAQQLDATESLPPHERVTSKPYAMRKLLQLRRDDPELFAKGDYQALQVEGERKEHIFAFSRTFEGRSCIVIVPRWTAKLMDCTPQLPLRERVWGDTSVVIGNGAVTAAPFKDVFTGQDVALDEASGARSVRMGSALSEYPVAVLSA
jgi:(1->4)-alpha-D-glucan 1-alpha-D-glucosylmutase